MGGGSECWQFDAVANSWTQKPLFASRIGGMAFSLGNYGYFGTGNGQPGYLHTDFWQFDPAK